MAPREILIRPARPGEAPILTDICLRAKAHWGYDAAFIAACAPVLRIREREIGAGGILVAQPGGDAMAGPCGVAALAAHPKPGWIELSHLFVAPENLRGGIGRALFRAAAALAAQRGARHLEILSDPFAAPFYERLGARRCGEAPSEVAKDRMLPLFAFALPEAIPSH